MLYGSCTGVVRGGCTGSDLRTFYSIIYSITPYFIVYFIVYFNVHFIVYFNVHFIVYFNVTSVVIVTQCF